jgi:hypothetical protein
MNIAVMKDGQIVVGDYRSLFPNTSFPASGPTAEWIAEQGWPVTVFKAHDRATQKLVPAAPYVEDGQVFTVAVEAKSQDDIDSDTASLAAQVRQQRDSKLAETDWVVIKATETGTPVPEAIALERQALRDITAQPSFPWEVQWPTQPLENEQ